VGDSWIRAAVRTGGVRTERGSAAEDRGKIMAGVRGSRGGITRERERILDLLLHTVLNGHQGDGGGGGEGEGEREYYSRSAEAPQKGTGLGRDGPTAPLPLFRSLFKAAHLGAALLHTQPESGSGSRDKGRDCPSVPLSPAGMSAQYVIISQFLSDIRLGGNCELASALLFSSILFSSIYHILYH
jgi:hypothetical protein